jgi:MFS family permease
MPPGSVSSRRPRGRGGEAGTSGTSWSKILLVYVSGLVAAMALGKIAPAGPRLQPDLGLTLTQLGWVMSALTAVAALLGAPAGVWIRHLGVQRTLVVGLGVMAAAGGIGAAAWSAGAMVTSRIVEGGGYLLVVVAGPSLIVRLARRQDQAAALALWGTFIPVGLAASAVLGGMLTSALGWRGWLGLAAVLSMVTSVIAALTLPLDQANPAASRQPLRPSSLGRSALLAAGFCSISLIGVAILSLLPTFLVEQHDTSMAAAGAATAVVSFSSVPGSLITGWLIRRGLGLSRLGMAGLAMPAAAVPAFLADGALASGVIAAVVLLLIYGGMIAGMFAAVPRIAQDQGLLDLTNGLVAQLGSLGSLLGPPLFSAVVTAAGWAAVAPLTLAFTLVGLGLWMAALRRQRG